MEINYICPKDLTEVIKLHKQIFAEDNPVFFSNLKTKPYYKTFAATQNNKYIAYCIITEIAGEAEIINIGTSEQFRGQGIAKNLLNYALKQIDSNVIFLEVSTKNLPAINLYKSCGFTSYSTRKNYYGDSDAVLMKLQK